MPAVLVPVELDFDAPILVGPDFLALLARDDGGLGAVDARFARVQRRPVDRVRGKRLEAVAVAFEGQGMGDMVQHVFFVPTRIGVLRHFELVAGNKAETVSLPLQYPIAPFQPFDPALGDFLAVAGFHEIRRVFVDPLVAGLAGHLHLQIRQRRFEVEIVHRVLAGADLLRP